MQLNPEARQADAGRLTADQIQPDVTSGARTLSPGPCDGMSDAEGLRPPWWLTQLEEFRKMTAG